MRRRLLCGMVLALCALGVQAAVSGWGKKVSTPYREQGTNYPEPRWAGPTPAYGLFARHVDGLHLQNVQFELLRSDERPDIILEDVKEL